MLGADDVELLLDFLLMTEAELVSGGGEREVAGGVLTRARERVAEWLCALCEATAAGRSALPRTVHDHLRAAGAPAMLALVSVLGMASEVARVAALRTLGALLLTLPP